MEKVFSVAATTVYRAFNKGRTYPEQNQHKKYLKLAQEKAQALEQRPAPLPPTRINLSVSDLSLKDPQQSQPACLLFQKLPPEIRTRIYEEVLGRSILRIVTVSKGVKHNRLLLPRREYDHRRSSSSSSSAPFNPIEMNVELDEFLDQYPTIDLRVLRTCHAVYAECMPILWRSNTIAMSSPLTLIYLHDYMLPPSHFDQIRHLQLSWTYYEDPGIVSSHYVPDHDRETWLRFWDLVASMELQSLRVNLGYIGPPTNKEGNISTEWTIPMLKVKGVRNVSCIVEGFTRPSDGFQGEKQLAKEIEGAWASGVSPAIAS